MEILLHGRLMTQGTGDKYLALFNASDSEGPVEISVKLDLIGLSSNHDVKDIWSGKSIGWVTDIFPWLLLGTEQD